MRKLPNLSPPHPLIDRVANGPTPYFRLRLKHHGSRFDILLDTLDEALIIRDSFHCSGPFFEEIWTVADVVWLRDRLRHARLNWRKTLRPWSFGPQSHHEEH